MGARRYSWWNAYSSALRESNPKKLIARIEEAMTAMERRYAEWGDNPGTPAELQAIRKAIATLQRCVHSWQQDTGTLEDWKGDPKVAS